MQNILTRITSNARKKSKVAAHFAANFAANVLTLLTSNSTPSRAAILEPAAPSTSPQPALPCTLRWKPTAVAPYASTLSGLGWHLGDFANEMCMDEVMLTRD